MSVTDTVTSAAWAGLLFRIGLSSVILLFILISLLLLFHRNYGKNVIARFTNNINGKTMDISSWEVSIGRARSCDIVLNYPTVSRFHAVVARRGKGWMIFDTGSKSGVFVNGEKIGKSAYIYDGDEIEMGTASLSFRSPLFRRPEAQQSAAPEPPQKTQSKKPARSGQRQRAGAPADTPHRRSQNDKNAGAQQTRSARQNPAAKTPAQGVRAAAGGQNPAIRQKTARPRRGSGYISALRNLADRSLVLLFANEYVIGRTQECGITLPVMTVSRRHAKLAKRDGRWTITDLDSKGGVWINNAKEKGTIVLYDGDVIDIGGVRFKYIEKYMEE
ncbi:MAG: FHA domain-containing protein [Clostridia bacterium]|nr:FHA domain-containing protein [Clostridia bacterium]